MEIDQPEQALQQPQQMQVDNVDERLMALQQQMIELQQERQQQQQPPVQQQPQPEAPVINAPEQPNNQINGIRELNFLLKAANLQLHVDHNDRPTVSSDPEMWIKRLETMMDDVQ